MTIDPDRNRVLYQQDWQHDRRRLHRRHHEREQRRRHQPDARKAALGEAEEGHRDDGREIKRRIGNHRGSRRFAVRNRNKAESVRPSQPGLRIAEVISCPPLQSASAAAQSASVRHPEA